MAFVGQWRSKPTQSREENRIMLLSVLIRWQCLLMARAAIDVSFECTTASTSGSQSGALLGVSSRGILSQSTHPRARRARATCWSLVPAEFADVRR